MYIIEGEVVHGDEIGRSLGFPTANIHMHDESVPDGVWAALVTLRGGHVRSAVVSVGRRPTFFELDNVRLLEAHIIDFSESIYGEWIVVQLLDYIRGQVRFGSIEQLVSAMHTDLKKAERIIGSPALNDHGTGKTASRAPKWALRRVRSALVSGNSVDVFTISRQLGMSKGLVRRCLQSLDRATTL